MIKVVFDILLKIASSLVGGIIRYILSSLLAHKLECTLHRDSYAWWLIFLRTNRGSQRGWKPFFMLLLTLDKIFDRRIVWILNYHSSLVNCRTLIARAISVLCETHPRVGEDLMRHHNYILVRDRSTFIERDFWGCGCLPLDHELVLRIEFGILLSRNLRLRAAIFFGESSLIWLLFLNFEQVVKLLVQLLLRHVHSL